MVDGTLGDGAKGADAIASIVATPAVATDLSIAAESRPNELDFSIHRRSDFSLVAATGQGTLSGITQLIWTVRRDRCDAEALLTVHDSLVVELLGVTVSEAGGSVTLVTGDQIQLALSADHSCSLPVGRWQYDVEAVWNGNVRSLITGTITVLRQVDSTLPEKAAAVPISGSSGFVGAAAADAAAEKASATYTIAASNALTWERDRADAVSSGTGDDQQLIAAAMAAGHRVIRLTGGGFVFDASLSILANLTLFGRGAETSISGAGVDLFNVTTAERFKLRKLSVTNCGRVVKLDNLAQDMKTLEISDVEATTIDAFLRGVPGTFRNLGLLVLARNVVDTTAQIAVNCECGYELAEVFSNRFRNIEQRAVRLGKDDLSLQPFWKHLRLNHNIVTNVSTTAGQDVYGLQSYSEFAETSGNEIEDLTGNGATIEGMYTKCRYGHSSKNKLKNAGRNEGAIVLKGSGLVGPTSPYGYAVICEENHVIFEGSPYDDAIGIKLAIEDSGALRGNIIEGVPGPNGYGILTLGSGAATSLGIAIDENKIFNVAGVAGIGVAADAPIVELRRNTVTKGSGTNAKQGYRITGQISKRLVMRGNSCYGLGAGNSGSTDAAVLIQPPSAFRIPVVICDDLQVDDCWRAIRFANDGAEEFYARNNHYANMGSVNNEITFGATAKPTIMDWRNNVGAKVRGLTFTDLDLTPTVGYSEEGIFICPGSSTYTITDFTDGRDGQVIHVLGDGLVTIQHGSKIKQTTGANYLIPSGVFESYKRHLGIWRAM